MNIGITCYPTYGGSGIVATELGMELAARGHHVHFIPAKKQNPCPGKPMRLDGVEPEKPGKMLRLGQSAHRARRPLS